jgi:two-component system, sporulation sensor kinase E
MADGTNQSSEALLAEIMKLEQKCQFLQEYNRELEEARNSYASVFDYSPVGYVILDSKGMIINANLTAATMLDMKKEKMVGLPFDMLVAQNDAKIFFDHLQRCKVTKARVCSEFEIKSYSGTAYSIQIISVPFVLLDQKTVYYNTAIVDISNQKRLELELQRLDRLNLVGEMAAGIAHEIRNPMTTVRGYLQLFERRSSNEQEMKDLQLMLEELDRANAIISEFLALAKNKNNKLVMKKINNIVQAIYPLVQAEATLTGNEIVLELFPHLPEVLIDGKEMRQVLLNLVSNALQSMNHGQVIIRTFIEDDNVVLAVEDQGHGIPEEIRHKIGTPFFTTKDSGTGLGMAICYSIVQRHNAKLEFTTSPCGTTFFIRFPCK